MFTQVNLTQKAMSKDGPFSFCRKRAVPNLEFFFFFLAQTDNSSRTTRRSRRFHVITHAITATATTVIALVAVIEQLNTCVQ